jgi:hypothetical protein
MTFFGACALPRVRTQNDRPRRYNKTDMVDYSKWDNLQDSDDDDAPPVRKPALPSSGPATAPQQV